MPEQYTYQVGKIHFIVTPVYKDKRSGETLKDTRLCTNGAKNACSFLYGAAARAAAAMGY